MQLKAQLLGQPLMEVRFAQPLNGTLSALRQRLDVESHGDTWVRYWAQSPVDDNPRLLHWLSDQKVDVVTLSEVTRSLEDVYLHVVEQPADAGSK